MGLIRKPSDHLWFSFDQIISILYLLERGKYMKKTLLIGVIANLIFASSLSANTDRLNELTQTLSEGSFSIDKAWNYSCSKDKFNGAKSCYLNKIYGDVLVGVYNGQQSVYVGRKHYPKSQSAIKVDNNQPVYGYEGSSSTPEKVIKQMKQGKIAYTRYKEWPYEYNQDNEVDLAGFAEKYNEMLEAYKKL